MSYFTTSIGFVVEVFRDGCLVDDFRHTERDAARDRLRASALKKAHEMAKKHDVPLDEIVYDLDGERDEESLFG